MAEGTKKSITERIEDTRRWQACEIQAETVSSPYVWDCHRLEHESITDENIKEHVEECLGEMLNNYIDDERNYALDGAVIKCDRMSDRKTTIEFLRHITIATIEGEEINEIVYSDYIKPADAGLDSEPKEIPSHAGEEKIRKLHASSGNSQSANGILFATVEDRSCLREEKAKAVAIKQPMQVKEANIVSCGNCLNLGGQDIEKIVENWEGVLKYGTCYALIQPVSKWENPYCMESVTGECKGEDLLSPFSGFDILGNTPESATCMREHHRPMKFSTLKGEKEGLTMMSTLLCGKRGIITIEAPGQIYIEPKAVDEEIGDLKEALNKMTQYLRKEGISQEELSSIITWVANNCGLTVNDMEKGDFSEGEAHERSQRYDEQIIAWTYYWNVKIQNEESFEYKFTIDPNIVKAMIAQESSFGSTEVDANKNPTRNVMQSLSTCNPPVWIAMGINPYDMLSESKNITFIDLNGNKNENGDLPAKNDLDYEDEREKHYFQDFEIIRDIFEEDEDGKFMVVFSNVTPDMSIATGIGWLANNIRIQGSISEGVMAYHSEGDEEYLGKINRHLENMGCEPIK